MKKLYRSRTDRKVCGLMGGLGEYFNVDANVLRLLFIFACIFTGLFPFVIAYILACFFIPEAPDTSPAQETQEAK